MKTKMTRKAFFIHPRYEYSQKFQGSPYHLRGGHKATKEKVTSNKLPFFHPMYSLITTSSHCSLSLFNSFTKPTHPPHTSNTSLLLLSLSLSLSLSLFLFSLSILNVCLLKPPSCVWMDIHQEWKWVSDVCECACLYMWFNLCICVWIHVYVLICGYVYCYTVIIENDIQSPASENQRSRPNQ